MRRSTRSRISSRCCSCSFPSCLHDRRRPSPCTRCRQSASGVRRSQPACGTSRSDRAVVFRSLDVTNPISDRASKWSFTVESSSLPHENASWATFAGTGRAKSSFSAVHGAVTSPSNFATVVAAVDPDAVAGAPGFGVGVGAGVAAGFTLHAANWSSVSIKLVRRRTCAVDLEHEPCLVEPPLSAAVDRRQRRPRVRQRARDPLNDDG